MPFLLTKFLEKGKNLQFFKHKSRTSFQKWRNLFSKIVKLVFKKLKLVFKMLKLVFKTLKLPCPAFSLQGLGWIPHKKKAWVLGKILHARKTNWYKELCLRWIMLIYLSRMVLVMIVAHHVSPPWTWMTSMMAWTHPEGQACARPRVWKGGSTNVDDTEKWTH